MVGSGTVSARARGTLGGVVVAAGAGSGRFPDAFATARIGSSGHRGARRAFDRFRRRVVGVRVLLVPARLAQRRRVSWRLQKNSTTDIAYTGVTSQAQYDVTTTIYR